MRTLKVVVMKVISSTKLRNNLKKYLDSARSEKIIIQRGRTETFVLTRQDDLPEDYYDAISMDKAIIRSKRVNFNEDNYTIAKKN